MAVGERQRRRTASFSSSLLDAIYQSIDEPTTDEHQRSIPQRRNAARIEEEIESLRRAIMVERWKENYYTAAAAAAKSIHLPSSSASSTDSGAFTSSETDSSVSLPTPKPLLSQSKIGGRFTRTKIRALKIYRDLKKEKEPISISISRGGRIANFLNSIFSPRNLKKSQSAENWGSARKSRSMKDTTTSLASRSCLSKNPNSSRSNKSKRSVRFCSVIRDENSINASMPKSSSHFIKKNFDSFRFHEAKNTMNMKFHENESEFDDKSCGSSDLFELENIEELPVYGTTSVKMNRAIASGLIV